VVLGLQAVGLGGEDRDLVRQGGEEDLVLDGVVLSNSPRKPWFQRRRAGTRAARSASVMRVTAAAMQAVSARMPR
jgi:hypothetical protein